MDEARISLFMSAYWKIPLQALVLIIGVLVFVFYLFTPPPMLFNRVHDARCVRARGPAEYAALEADSFMQAVDRARRRRPRSWPRHAPSDSRGRRRPRRPPSTPSDARVKACAREAIDAGART